MNNRDFIRAEALNMPPPGAGLLSRRRIILAVFGGILLGAALFASCTSLYGAVSAEEYYSLGIAYFDLGKYEEAEKWLNRARMVDKTQVASDYTLGRIAFELGRYQDAAAIFEKVLERDPDNVMALKAAAYTRIKLGDFAAAEAFYSRIMALVPESADDGYNYALMLYATEQYARTEAVLAKYQYALEENNDVLLLYARSQRAQNKVEAVDSYSLWLTNNKDLKVQYEYARVLEQAELYVRALEQYREILNGLAQDSTDPKKPDVRYAAAKLLLIADPENEEGIVELKKAVDEGFEDTGALEEFLQDERITEGHRQDLRDIIDAVLAAQAEKRKAEEEAPEEGEAEAGEINETGLSPDEAGP
ncbi:MAG: tetratricopeptide repeat protein [Treponema sp.]|jgi:tetratricopeptide (TPR) repeat protein|nr:tetratricopeptide repeat protein [Treponema sp.]